MCRDGSDALADHLARTLHLETWSGVTAIVAVGPGDIIGRSGGMPWRVREDLRWFRRATMGLPVIMGARTAEPLRGRLKGRALIALSRRELPGFRAPADEGEGALAPSRALDLLAGSPEMALALAHRLAGRRGVMIGGGGKTFRVFAPVTEAFVISRLVPDALESGGGDVHFDPAWIEGFHMVRRAQGAGALEAVEVWRRTA